MEHYSGRKKRKKAGGRMMTAQHDVLRLRTATGRASALMAMALSADAHHRRPL
jgi:hypothetical protein